MQVYIRSIIITSVLMFLSSTAISGQNFTVGTENQEYLPFSASVSGKATGFFKDVLDEFGKSKGYTFTFAPTPVKRLMNNLITDKIDFKIPDNPIWASSLKTGKNITYSTPLTVYMDGVLVQPKNINLGYENLSTLVTVRGFTPFIFLDDISKGSIKLQETSDLAAVIKMVSVGRAQGGFANITVAQRYMKDTLKKPDLLVYDENIPTAKSDISLSTTKHPKIIEEFNAFLQSHAQWIADLKKEQDVP
jgi:polar amino acid transport system substrate-binding protein